MDDDRAGDRFETYDPVAHQLAAIQTRLDGIETAISLRNARQRRRAALRRSISYFLLGLVVGASIVALARLLLS